MSRAPIESQPTTPLSVRLFDRIPLPAFFGGIAVGLAVFALFLLYTALFGAGPGRLADVAFAHGWAAELLQDLFLGFSVAVVAASLRGVREELEALRPSLEPPLRDAPDLVQQVLRHPRLPLALVTLCAVLSAIATVESPRMWVGGQAFLLPLRRPHRRLRAAKRADLLRVRAAIRVARDRVLDAPAQDLAGGRLADLVAYEARVAAASEWPIAASTVARLGLYVALGLSSWIGAGVVQYGIESALP